MSAVKEINLASVPETQTSMPRGLLIMTVLSVIGVLAGVGTALFYAGTDLEQGEVQKIFYIHMPAFFGAFVAFSATVIGGVQYLRTRNLKWDTLALAGAEVGLLFALMNLLTGSIWARPIWNTWWTWDPRLTSAAIMALTYAAYLMLRAGIDNPDARRRFASVYGIVAIVTVIMTLIIIRIRPDTIHPAVIGPSPQNAEGDFGLTSTMRVALMVNLPVWGLIVPVTLMWYRIRLQNFAERVQAFKLEVLNRS